MKKPLCVCGIAAAFSFVSSSIGRWYRARCRLADGLHSTLRRWNFRRRPRETWGGEWSKL